MSLRTVAIVSALGLLLAYMASLAACAPAQASPAIEILQAAPAARPTLMQVQGARERAVESGEMTIYTQAVTSVAGVHLFGSDLASAKRSEEITQNLRITHRGTSGTVCFYTVAYSAGCATDCPAGTEPTCDGSSTDGDPILTSSPTYYLPIRGDLCPCARASTGTISTTATRVVRSGS